MKENFLKSTGRAALAATFLLGLFLPARARAQANRQVWLKIMAFTDAPVVGADVRVTLGGPHGPVLVNAKAATNNQGVFPAPVSRPWILSEEAAADAKTPEPDRRRRRSFVRISISGGTVNGEPFLGHLSASVALADLEHQILVVNPVTTLVSLLLDERPELTLQAADAVVRHFLRLPANYSLDLALRQSSHYRSPFFSPVAFMAEARDVGGLDVFQHVLLQELESPSARHPFRPPQLLGSSGSSDAASVIQAGLYAGLLDAASAEGVGGLAGWALSLTGLFPTPSTTQADIDALTGALNNLQSSIDNLASQVTALSNLVQSTTTQTQYNTIVVPAQTLEMTVNGVESDLAYFANACPPQYVGQTKPNPEPYCTNQKGSISTELNDVTIQQAYVTMEGYVKDNTTTGFRGMLHLYSLWLAQSKPFFRPADSTKMQNLYDYWDAALTQAANLKIELLHENDAQDGNPKQLTDFMGNPNATPPTTGLFQANQAANLMLRFPPVPAGTVVSTQDHTMWSLLPWGWKPGCPVPNCLTTNVSPSYSCSTFTDPALRVIIRVNGINQCCISKSPYAGFNDWESTPTKAQWQAAVLLAPTNTTWQDWLTQQTKTTGDETPASSGFFNEISVCAYYGAGPGSPPPAIWTSTVDHYNGQFPVNWTIHLQGNSAMPYYDRQSVDYGNNYNFDNDQAAWPARVLAPGEQYFWYQ